MSKQLKVGDRVRHIAHGTVNLEGVVKAVVTEASTRLLKVELDDGGPLIIDEGQLEGIDPPVDNRAQIEHGTQIEQPIESTDRSEPKLSTWVAGDRMDCFLKGQQFYANLVKPSGPRAWIVQDDEGKKFRIFSNQMKFSDESLSIHVGDTCTWIYNKARVKVVEIHQDMAQIAIESPTTISYKWVPRPELTGPIEKKVIPSLIDRLEQLEIQHGYKAVAEACLAFIRNGLD